jgi:D-methionine transport system ATP-binding protein
LRQPLSWITQFRTLQICNRFVTGARLTFLPLTVQASRTVIEIRGVGKTYHTPTGAFQALRGVDLEIAKGEIFGIIGRSGAGKSTLLRTINLLERPTTGRVLVEGTDVTDLDGEPLRRLRQRVGIIFQHFNLLNSKTVQENVRLPLRVAGELERPAQDRRVAELLELVGLARHAAKYPAQLSGGERQRVGIARALANGPHILLCDEATSALDPETTQSILQLLLQINQRLALTIVLITHGMDVIRAVADRVAILDHGTVVESGKVVEVFLNPRNSVTRALLAESGIESEVAITTDGGDGSQVLRLTYHGALTEQPLLTTVSRESGLDFAILQASVGRLKGVPYGRLTIRTSPLEQDSLQRLLQALDAQGIRHEVLR